MSSPHLGGLVLSALMLAGCSRSPSASPGTEQASDASRPPQLHSAKPGVFAMACSAECSDDLATLTVYRDHAGAIGVVSVQGSPSRCSHPPLVFFGPDGKERAAIPFAPVKPGSPEAKRYQEIREQQTGALTKSETMSCRDVKH